MHVSKKQRPERTDLGPQWFNLPKQEMTKAIKQDLEALNLRQYADPARFYKVRGYRRTRPAGFGGRMRLEPVTEGGSDTPYG